MNLIDSYRHNKFALLLFLKFEMAMELFCTQRPDNSGHSI